MVKAEHVNPFILSVCKVVKDVCMMDLKIGKPGVKKEEYPDDASIIELGIVGGLSGKVILNMEHPAALEIISKMMMQPVNTIDEIGQSAISELGNMIAGNAATVFATTNIVFTRCRIIMHAFDVKSTGGIRKGIIRHARRYRTQAVAPSLQHKSGACRVQIVRWICCAFSC